MKNRLGVSLLAATMLAPIAMTMLAPAAYAADQATMSPAKRTADRDFGKLSDEGSKAFRDIAVARFAIFTGETGKAKQLIDMASASLVKAQSDNTAFTKAESELTPPAGTAASQNRNTASTTPIRWLPIGGSLTLGEDYAASNQKSQGVAQANNQIKTGNKKSAIETLRLADISVIMQEDLAPLEQTITGVAKAKQLVDSGHYYEANQTLKTVQDGVRVDVQVANNAVPPNGTGDHAISAAPNHPSPTEK